MTSHDHSRFIESPIQSSQRVKSFPRFIESPIKVTKRQNEENFISPYRPIKQFRYDNDFIENPIQSVRRKNSSTKRDRPRRPAKSREKKNVDSEFFKDDDGDDSEGMRFDDDDESPERDYGFVNDIDWNIIDNNVEELRSKTIREY